MTAEQIKIKLSPFLCNIDIKYLAIIVMTIDHFATLFLPEASWLYLFCRSLGRMAAPLFAYLLVAGLLKSRDSNRYARRLLIYALISQFPYAWKAWASLDHSIGFWMLVFFDINVLLSLFCALVALQDWQRIRETGKSPAQVLLPGLFLWFYLSLFADNGGFIPLWVLVFYALRNHPVAMCWCYLVSLLMFTLAGLAYGGVMFPPTMLWWSLPGYAAVFFVLRRTPPPQKLYDGKPRPGKWQRHFFYAWYPLHLLVLTGLYLALQVK